MAEEKKSVEISYKANISDLKKKLEQLPDITSDEAKKMVSALDRQLKQAERAAQRSAKASARAARASAKAAKESSKSFKEMASSAGIVAGAFAGLGIGAVRFQQEIADLTNEMVDASAKTGIAVETLAGLRLAAEGSGIEFSQLEGGLIKFQSSIQNAGKGTGAMAEAFDSLGVEVKDANGELRESDAVFNDAIKALGSMENLTDRNATAMQLFGRTAGAGLIQSGALDNLQAMTDLANEFGVAMDEKAVKAAADFQRQMAEFETVAQRSLQDLINAVAGDGTITMGLDAMTKGMIYFGSIAEDVIGAVSQQFENVFGWVQAVTMILSGESAQAFELLKSLGEDSEEAFGNLLDSVDRAGEAVDRYAELSEKARNAAAETAEIAKKTEESEKKTTNWKKIQLDLERQRKKELEEALSFGDDQIKQQEAKTALEKQLFELQATELEKQILKIDEKYNSEIERIQELALISGEIENAQMVADELRKQRQQEINDLQDEGAKKTLQDISELTGQTLGAMGDTLETAGSMVTEFAGKNREAQVRAFNANKALSIASVTMKTAEAIIAAQSLPPPVNIIASINAAAVGAAQLAKIQSTQPSFHMGGVAPDETMARLQQGEGILSAQAVRRIGGEKGLDKIERGEGAEKETVVVIQPFKHFGRFAKEIGYKKPKQTGAGAY